MLGKLITKALRTTIAKNNSYLKETENIFQVFNDTGKYGEFLTSNILDKVKGYKKILLNTYIKRNHKDTTEIDVLMIHGTGIYVFESKNYSGWIFGNEKNTYWTQSLAYGKQKEKFYNPILQNKTHINVLNKLLTNIDSKFFYSYIVFSERCNLVKITLESTDIKVLKRDTLFNTLKRDIKDKTTIFDNTQIDKLYETILNCIFTDDDTKQKHIETINSFK